MGEMGLKLHYNHLGKSHTNQHTICVVFRMTAAGENPVGAVELELSYYHLGLPQTNILNLKSIALPALDIFLWEHRNRN